MGISYLSQKMRTGRGSSVVTLRADSSSSKEKMSTRQYPPGSGHRDLMSLTSRVLGGGVPGNKIREGRGEGMGCF